MAKMRPGIEIPIIPEDFIISEEDLCPNMRLSSSQWADPSFQEELFPTDWVLTESIVYQHPKG